MQLGARLFENAKLSILGNYFEIIIVMKDFLNGTLLDESKKQIVKRPHLYACRCFYDDNVKKDYYNYYYCSICRNKVRVCHQS